MRGPREKKGELSPFFFLIFVAGKTRQLLESPPTLLFVVIRPSVIYPHTVMGAHFSILLCLPDIVFHHVDK